MNNIVWWPLQTSVSLSCHVSPNTTTLQLSQISHKTEKWWGDGWPFVRPSCIVLWTLTTRMHPCFVTCVAKIWMVINESCQISYFMATGQQPATGKGFCFKARGWILCAVYLAKSVMRQHLLGMSECKACNLLTNRELASAQSANTQ